MYLKPFLMIYKKSPSEWDEKDAEVYCRFIEEQIRKTQLPLDRAGNPRRIYVTVLR